MKAAPACASAALFFALTAPALGAGLLEPTTISDETYAESFTLSVDLGGGGYLQGQLAVSNLGPGDGQGACRFMYVAPNGKESSSAEKFDRDEWNYQGKGDPRLTVGPCSLTAKSDSVHFVAKLGDNELRVDMNAKPQRVKPPEHEVKVGGAFYQTEIIIPWSKISGSLKLNGKAIVLKGHGFMDHSRSTILPGKLANRWVRFRVLDPQDPRLFLVRYPADGKKAQAWAWTAGDPAPKSVARVKVSRKPGKTPVFRALAMVKGKTWKMTSEKLIHRYAPVEKHGMIGALVGAVVGNPITYTYVGKLEQGAKTLRGIMEVTVLKE